jgi:hypothetical protein
MNEMMNIKEASEISDSELEWDYADDIRALVMAQIFAMEIQDVKARNNIKGKMRYYYKKTSGARKGALFILLLMFIFSKPAWCVRMGDNISNDCEVDTDGNDYHTLISTFVSPRVSVVITLLCMYFIFCLQYLKITSSSEPDQIDYIKLILQLGIIAIKMIFILMETFELIYPSDFSNVFKLLFVMIYFKSVIKSFVKIYKMILSSGSMLLMMVLVLFVFSTLARILLQGISIGDDGALYAYSFTDIFRSIDSMFLLMIMENFPDVCLEANQINFVVMMFFYFYILISAIVIISLLTGVFYFYFRNFYTDNLREIGKKYPHFITISEPFMEEPFLNPHAVDRVIKETKKKMKNEELENPLTEEELLEKRKQVKQHFLAKVRRAIRKIKKLRIYEKTAKFSKYREHFTQITNSFFYRFIVFLLCTYNTFFPIFILDRENLLMVTDYLQFSEMLAVLFLMELYMKYTFVTQPIFWTFDNICDFIASMGMIVLSNIIFIAPSSLSDEYAMGNVHLFTVWSFCCFLRLIRMHVILMEYINYRVIIKTIKDIFPLIMDLLSMYIVILLFYGVLGMALFGGSINSGFGELFESNTGDEPPEDWERFNFNDPIGSLLFLFLQNLGGYLDFIHLAMGTIPGKGMFVVAKIYFYSFIILTELILINIIVGFIIEFLDVYMGNNEEQRDKEISMYKKKKIVDILVNNNQDADMEKLEQITNASYNNSNFEEEEEDVEEGSGGDEDGGDDNQSINDIKPEEHFSQDKEIISQSDVKETK